MKKDFPEVLNLKTRINMRVEEIRNNLDGLVSELSMAIGAEALNKYRPMSVEEFAMLLCWSNQKIAIRSPEGQVLQGVLGAICPWDKIPESKKQTWRAMAEVICRVCEVRAFYQSEEEIGHGA